VITPGDSRSFIAHVTKADLKEANINVSDNWSNNLLLIVNHGKFKREDVAQPPVAVPVPLGASTAPNPVPAELDWQIRVYDPAQHAVVGFSNGVDNPCMHD
jgi:hypothetical protein